MIGQYKGHMPLASWLKDYYRENRQMGGGDRRIVSELLYCYYRLGHISNELTTENRILISLFLCNQVSNPILQYFKPLWNDKVTSDLPDKLASLSSGSGININLNEIFPFTKELSAGIDLTKFTSSFLNQPRPFIRIRPGMERTIKRKLTEANIAFRKLSDKCVELPIGTKADLILKLDSEAVIQDYNSQKTGDFLKLLQPTQMTPTFKVLDCCAGSGGKSIMANDIFENLQLTVIDKRSSILENLRKRFTTAGILNYRYLASDLSKTKMNSTSTLNNYNIVKAGKALLSSEPSTLIDDLFDLVICDVPCTGSGTWARSPEQLYFFNRKELVKYSLLQKQILENVFHSLSPGGKLLYITCSVFKAENEDNVVFMQEHLHLHLETSSLLKGYSLQADTMFVALFTAPIN